VLGLHAISFSRVASFRESEREDFVRNPSDEFEVYDHALSLATRIDLGDVLSGSFRFIFAGWIFGHPTLGAIIKAACRPRRTVSRG